MFAAMFSFFVIVGVVFAMIKCVEHTAKGIGNVFGIHSVSQVNMTLWKCKDFHDARQAGEKPSWLQLANELANVNSREHK